MYKEDRFDKSLDAFIAFVESKPADEKYQYGYHDHCAVAQFRKHMRQKYSAPAVGDHSIKPSEQSFAKVIERLAVDATRPGTADIYDFHCQGSAGTFGALAILARHARENDAWLVRAE